MLSFNRRSLYTTSIACLLTPRKKRRKKVQTRGKEEEKRGRYSLAFLRLTSSPPRR